MPRTALKSARTADPLEKRALPRKKALLTAVIVDVGGTTACDCTIQDITIRSAQIGFARPIPIGTQIYLLDASNRIAHLARVVWCRSERAGVSFIQSHEIGWKLPSSLKFLWRVFLEAKFKEVYRLVSTGVKVVLALSTAGLDEEHLRQMGRYVRFEKRFEILLRLTKGKDIGIGTHPVNATSKAWPA